MWSGINLTNQPYIVLRSLISTTHKAQCNWTHAAFNIILTLQNQLTGPILRNSNVRPKGVAHVEGVGTISFSTVEMKNFSQLQSQVSNAYNDQTPIRRQLFVCSAVRPADSWERLSSGSNERANTTVNTRLPFVRSNAHSSIWSYTKNYHYSNNCYTRQETSQLYELYYLYRSQGGMTETLISKCYVRVAFFRRRKTNLY